MGRRASPRVLFGYFLHDAKSDNSFPFRELSRFYEPRISPPKQKLPTNKIKTSPKEESRFFKPQFSSPQWRLRTDKIKSFRRHRRHHFLLLSQQILCASRYYRRLRRLSNFPFGKFVEVLQTSNQHTQTTVNLIKIRKIHINPLKISL